MFIFKMININLITTNIYFSIIIIFIKFIIYKIPDLKASFMVFDANFYQNIFTINEEHIVSAVQGGIMIAIASSIYYMFYGNILGMSGLVGTVLKGNLNQEARLKFTIIAGLIFSSSLITYMQEQKHTDFYPFDQIQAFSPSGLFQLVIAGSLVGIGTTLGSGCTSGHGLCGMARLSIRSICAVLIFLSVGIITATFELSSLIPAIPKQLQFALPNNLPSIYYMILFSILPFVFYIFSTKKTIKSFLRTTVYFIIGSIFGFGLMMAGMTQRSKIKGFLQLSKNWDPSLLIVLMTGVAINLVIFTMMRKGIKKPFFQKQLFDAHGLVDIKLIAGAAIFGLGWGVGGLCPGPFLLLIPHESIDILLYFGVPFLVCMKITQIFTTHGPAVVQKVKTT